MSYNIKSIKEEFKAKGVFYTQPKLAEYMKSFVDISVSDVYDPTCGDGGLLSVFPDDLPKFGQEINGEQLDVAKTRLKNFTGVCGDTLTNPAFIDRKFSCIIANPPFSIKWQPPVGFFKDACFADAPVLPPPSKADYAFLLHIVHLLADNGIAVVLNFPGVLYRGHSEGELRKWFVQNNWIDKIVAIPTKTFVDTDIATAIIILKKNRPTTDIEFVDSEFNLSRKASLEEIEANGFNLSVSAYVQKEVKKEHIDPVQLQAKARKTMVQKLKKDIEFDKMVCTIEGWSFSDYIAELKALVDSYVV